MGQKGGQLSKDNTGSAFLPGRQGGAPRNQDSPVTRGRAWEEVSSATARMGRGNREDSDRRSSGSLREALAAEVRWPQPPGGGHGGRGFSPVQRLIRNRYMSEEVEGTCVLELGTV